MNMKLDELAAEYIGTKMNVTFEGFMANKIEALESALADERTAKTVLEEKLRSLQSEFDACHITKNIVRDTLEKTEEKLKQYYDTHIWSIKKLNERIESEQEKLRVATWALESVRDHIIGATTLKIEVYLYIDEALAKINGTTDEDRKRAIDYVCDKKGW